MALTKRIKDKCVNGHAYDVYGLDNEECSECRRIRQRKQPWNIRRGAQYLPNLKGIRLNLGCTQREFAQLVSLNVRHYRKIENLERMATPAVQQRIIAAILTRQREFKSEFARGVVPAGGKPGKNTLRARA